ncbi:MAG: DUF4239 domain-containing protein [Verrucomicrobia bacterium]|jgi:hypothetical protein|nr:DUF4239 domain-containing protein [Verrucomicrobiota bacterium]
MQLGNTLTATLFVLALFLGMLLALEVGRRLGKRRLARDPEGAKAGLGAVEASVFGLLGLLVAFTFNGAANRFDQRRDLIVQEANAIGTAWLRLDALPDPTRLELRDLFRRYVDSRLESYRRIADATAAQKGLADSKALQAAMWEKATTACRSDPGRGVAMLVLPALNEMYDVATVRTAMVSRHPPRIVFFMLSGLSLSCSLLAGYGMAAARERSWTHMIAFAAITALTVYVIVDLEHPRRGFIRVTASDQLLVELRKSMD